MANATWAAGRAARERGAEGWLARAYARGATNAPIVAGAISEADILAFANAAATRDPPHAPGGSKNSSSRSDARAEG